MDRYKLKALLYEHFNLEDLRSLCFDLRIDFDDLRGETKSTKLVDFLNLILRSRRIADLANILKSIRPNISWDSAFRVDENNHYINNLDEWFSEANKFLLLGDVGRAFDLYQKIQSVDANFDGLGPQLRRAERELNAPYMTSEKVDRQKLLKLFQKSFNSTELRILSLDLGITDPYKENKYIEFNNAARTIIKEIERFIPIDQLLEYLIKTRGYVNWESAFAGTQLVTYKSYLDSKTGLEMVLISSGSFLFGENKQTISLPEFYISRTPVTNRHYAQYLANIDLPIPNYWQTKLLPKHFLDHPVVNISFNDAAAYTRWAGMQLPSEEQWEKAARGIDGRSYPWGDQWREGYCHNVEGGFEFTTPVGKYSPRGDSPYGCVDMLGNVFEWTNSSYELVKNCRILRGGSLSVERRQNLITRGFYALEAFQHNAIGFRVITAKIPDSAI
jgi:formylglycine-generating enzyme required for sulfatase activity